MKQYEDMEATELYCPRCRRAMPVFKRLLLILPDGELYDYRCRRCGESLGTKRERQRSPMIVRGT